MDFEGESCHQCSRVTISSNSSIKTSSKQTLSLGCSLLSLRDLHIYYRLSKSTTSVRHQNVDKRVNELLKVTNTRPGMAYSSGCESTQEWWWKGGAVSRNWVSEWVLLPRLRRQKPGNKGQNAEKYMLFARSKTSVKAVSVRTLHTQTGWVRATDLKQSHRQM